MVDLGGRVRVVPGVGERGAIVKGVHETLKHAGG